MAKTGVTSTYIIAADDVSKKGASIKTYHSVAYVKNLKISPAYILTDARFIFSCKQDTWGSTGDVYIKLFDDNDNETTLYSKSHGVAYNNWQEYSGSFLNYLKSPEDNVMYRKFKDGYQIGYFCINYESLLTRTYHTKDVRIVFTYDIPDLTVNLNAGVGGTVSGGGVYEAERVCAATATPNSGYKFVKWIDSNGNTVSELYRYQFYVRKNVTYTAIFEPITYTIKYVDNAGTNSVSASFGQEVAARAISDKNITITYNETSSRGKTEIYKFPVRGWKDSNSIVAKDGKTYTVDVFDAPFYANKYSDLYNIFGYNKYGLINHYIDYGASEGRQCKPNSTEPCGVYLPDRAINSLSTTHGQQVVLEAVYEDSVLVTVGDISKSGYIFKGWQSPEHTELLQPGAQVYFTDSATLTAVWEAVATPPEFTSASLTYAGAQVSAGNKVPAGENCILSVGVT